MNVLLGLWLILDICSLSVLKLVLMYSSETMIWKKERPRIRAVQMDNLRDLLGVRKMNLIRQG